VNDEAGKSRGERVALGESVFLEEEVEGAVRAVEIATVRVGIHEVEVMKKGMEAGLGFKNVFTLIAGHLVPAINKVNEKTGASGRLISGKGFGNKSIILAVGGVHQEIEAALNGEAKLTFG
jgi:hypothetical protein